jgi:hypothetical protein
LLSGQNLLEQKQFEPLAIGATAGTITAIRIMFMRIVTVSDSQRAVNFFYVTKYIQ